MAKMSVKELSELKADKRKKQYNSGKKMHGIHLRKALHFIVSAVLKIDQITEKEKIVIIEDKRCLPRGKPIIYACTHPGGDEIQRAFQVIGKPAYIMLGNPKNIYRMPIYYGLLLNGAIPLETFDREDRKIAYHRSVELLTKGGNLLIFPEGVWNTTPNSLVMKIFTGAVRMAKETGAEIVPIAIQQYGETFYFNIGENYLIPENTEKSVEFLNNELRDKLSTLQYELLSCAAPLNRSEIDNSVTKFQEEHFGKAAAELGFTVEDTAMERFHDKNITDWNEAFAHLTDLRPSRSNAFLFDKRLK